MKAYLVLGPESSGTRMMTDIMIAAGCDGTSGHSQIWDAKPPDGNVIVWRRSIPHSGVWPDIARMVELLRGVGYTVMAVVMQRDWHTMTQSQIRDAQHAPDRDTALINIARAYVHIFDNITRARVPFVLAGYGDIVRNEGSVRALLRLLELPDNITMPELYDGDGKYYE